MAQHNGVKAQTIARKCADAYSTFRYRSWPGVAEALLDRGLSELETEAVMRSKWMRWAADGHSARYGSVPAKAILQFLDSLTNEREEIAELTTETFHEIGTTA